MPPGGPGGYPMAPGAGPNIGDGVKWAINKFGQNAGVMLAFAAIIMVINLIGRWASSAVNSGANDVANNVEDCANLTGDAYLDCLTGTTTTSTGLLLGMGLLSLIISIVFWVLTVLAQIGLINASLKITRGERPAFSDLWTPQHFWQFIFVSILYGLAVGFGLLLCLIPGLLVIWGWQFAQYSALNSGPGVFASFGESWRMVMANKGPAVVTLLVLFVASLITLITCGIGALVVAPFSTLFMANMFRQFRKEPVAA
ncbi:MAG: hypothetical protein QG597_4514 [Actinomycetota bacterium]|nr:hypothetical protein [Actinomycetota bacterium]